MSSTSFTLSTNFQGDLALLNHHGHWLTPGAPHWNCSTTAPLSGQLWFTLLYHEKPIQWLEYLNHKSKADELITLPFSACTGLFCTELNVAAWAFNRLNVFNWRRVNQYVHIILHIMNNDIMFVQRCCIHLLTKCIWMMIHALTDVHEWWCEPFNWTKWSESAKWVVMSVSHVSFVLIYSLVTGKKKM